MTGQLTIEIQQEQPVYKPGELLEGTIGWNLDDDPENLQLSFFWHTSGKGTKDVNLVERQNYERPFLSGTDSFSFTVPQGPYSFSGTLISLQWSLELTVKPKGPTLRKDITIATGDTEVTLSKIEVPDKKSAFQIGR